jgi:ornithine carbamoyltransferase
MGQEVEAEQRRTAFALFQVTDKMLSRAKKDVIFMHPLPAHHGEEIIKGLLDHPSSVVFDQAENRLHIQRALLAELFRAF